MTSERGKMTDERLKEIQERLDKATPGPWERAVAPRADDALSKAEWQERLLLNSDEPLHVVTAKGDARYAYLVPAITGDGPQSRADADFIAHAREDITLLLAENAQLRAELVEEIVQLIESKANSVYKGPNWQAAEGYMAAARLVRSRDWSKGEADTHE